MAETAPHFDWMPDPGVAASSHLRRFMDRHGLDDVPALLARAAGNPAWFWDEVLRHELGVLFDQPYRQVLDESRGVERPAWCVGGRMNVTRSLLDKWIEAGRGERTAIRWEGEGGEAGTLTYRQLRDEVDAAAAGLRAAGVRPGEVVAVYMPMTPRCVIAMLAIIRAGGIFLPLFSGYGPTAIVQRLTDAGASALFCADGFRRRGKWVASKPVVDEAAAACPSLRRVIVDVQQADSTPRHERDRTWEQFVVPGASPRYEVCDADSPCMLIYTSGTTGRPKGAVHTHCGFPVKAAQDMLHGLDLRRDENLLWVTDIGWMMGPWLVFGTLMLGATMTLYDGALDVPDPGRLWDVCGRHGVTTLGVSPTLVRVLAGDGNKYVKGHDLSALRKFASTGEPWNEAPWRWLFETVGGRRLPVINYSGGTEISGGILMGNVLTPCRPCAFSGPVPGMAVDILDASGNSLLDKPGNVGELVIRAPWIGMTRGFWKDEQRYLDTYWSRFPGVWVHGDWASVDQDGLWYIHGRSDDTIKVAGKRLGPAEAESVVVSHPEVREAAAVGLPDDVKGQALVLVVVPRTHPPAPGLGREVSDLVARELGKPLTPRDVVIVPDLPKTRNGKVMRRVVRAALLGEDVGDVSALDNPASVEHLRR